MTAKHTPAPWVVNTAGSAKKGEPFRITEIYVYAPNTQDDTAICADVIDPVTQAPSEANARRIVACVNACEGIPTARLEAGSADVLAYSMELHKQRDELLEALKNLVGLAKLGAAPLHNYKAAIQVADDAIAKARSEA